MIIPAPIRTMYPNNYYPPRSELPAVLTDISDAIQGLKSLKTQIIKEMAWFISDNRGAPRRSFLSVEHWKSSSIRRHQTTQCLVRGLVHPSGNARGRLFDLDPACEVNERGTLDKNDGNEVVDDFDLPLDLELAERAEVDDETLPYAEEDWDRPEQTEIDKGIEQTFLSPWKHARAREEGTIRSTTPTARISP